MALGEKIAAGPCTGTAAGEKCAHPTAPLAQREDPADPILALLDRLDRALISGGPLEVDGQRVTIRPVAAGCYAVARQP